MPFPYLKDIYGFFSGAAKRASLGHLNQLVLTGLFVCFAALDKNPSDVKAKRALLGLFTAFAALQSYGSIGKLKISVEQGKILDAVKAFAGVATVPAAIEVISGHTAIKAITGTTDLEIPAYTFASAFAIDALIDLGIGIYEASQKHFAVGARFITFGALEGVEAYLGVWKGIIDKNPTGAALGAAAELVKCGLSLSGQAPEKPLTVKEIEVKIAAARAQLEGLETKKSQVAPVSDEEAALLRTGN